MSKTVLVRERLRSETYALQFPFLISSFAFPATLSTSVGWLTTLVVLVRWLDLAAGEERELGAMESRVIRVGDSGGEVWSLVCGDC